MVQNNSHHIITSSKLAAALAAVGVPLVYPQITRSKFTQDNKPKVRVAFYFATTTLDGMTSTFDLVKAWHQPHKFIDKPEPLCLMGSYRAALENNSKLVDAAHKFLKDQDRGELAEFEPTLMEASRHPNVRTYSLIPKGKVHILVEQHAQPEHVNKLVEIADKVNKTL